MKNHRDPNENRPGYKKTKVGWIPEEWMLFKMGEIMEFKNGVNASKEDYGKGVKFINVMEVINNNFITSDMIPGNVHLSENAIKENLVKHGDILFNRTSETPDEIGLTAVYTDTEKVVFGGFVIRGRFKNNSLDILFNRYCFRSQLLRKQIIFHGQGAIRANIGQADLEKVLLPVPPLPEQKKIAEVLSAWDRAIKLTRKLIEVRKKRKKALMQQLLTGKRRLPGFDGGWSEHKLGGLFTERNEGGNNHLELLAITGKRGIIPASEIERKDSSNEDKSLYKRIVPGDIGYNTMRMWQGVSALSDLEGIVSPAYTICVPNKAVDARFAAYLFKTTSVIHLFWRYSQGMVNDTLLLKFHNFSEIKIKISEKAEQSAIADVFVSVDEEIELLEKELSEYEKQKRGLMQKLLTGQVRVKV